MGRKNDDVEAPGPEKETADDDATTNSNGSKKESQMASSEPSLRRLFGMAKPEIPMLVFSCIVMVAAEAVNLVSPLIVAEAFDILIDPTLTDEDARMNEINRVMLIVVIVTLAGIIGSFIRASIQAIIGERVVARLRCQLYARILKQEIAFFDEHKSGELVSRLGSDTTLLQTAVSTSLPDFFVQLIKAIAAMCLMFSLSAELAGIATGGVVVIACVSAPMFGIMAKLSKEYQEVLGIAQSHSTETIGSMRTVQGFAAEEKESKRYDQKIGNPDDVPCWWPPVEQKTTYRVGFFKGVAQSGFFTFIFGAGFGYLNITLWYGFYLVTRGELTLGQLTAFNSFIITIGFALGQGAAAIGKMVEGMGASGRVFYLLDRTPNIPKPSSENMKDNTIKPESMEGNIELQNVMFHYPSRPNQIVLNNVSLTIPKGSTTALVGSSGAGKSTIVSLLQRFYDVDEGVITIDGHILEQLDLQWLRSNIGYVQQEPQLFGLTVKENITYGVHREVTQEEIEQAATDANAHEFISSWPEGYDTLVGERGVKLSGGQKQRVAIARALMTNCRILLLDEATSALDAESEHLVQQAIDKAVVGRTVVVVAHRLSTIRQADQIVVMDNHQVVDVGKHEELMSRCTKYQDLIRRQSMSVVDDPSMPESEGEWVEA